MGHGGAMRKGGLQVNPGRKPTPIGGDGILPYVLVPQELTGHVVRYLDEHGFCCEVKAGFMRSADRSEPRDTDKSVLPSARAAAVQKLLDELPPPPWWPYGQ